jgi:hypothetical protein
MGSKKIAWNHGLANQISYEFYQLNKEGEMEYNTFFFKHLLIKNQDIDDDEIICMVALPKYKSKNDFESITKEVINQAYLLGDNKDISILFRVTEEQYNELTKNYFLAQELSIIKKQKVNYSYFELFNKLIQ